METSWLQIATLAIAVIGAVLGVLNTWRTFNSDRVRLHVQESHGFGSGGDRLLVLNVLNLSSFPITITSLGLDTVAGGRHMQIVRPIFTGGESLPVRLEPRTAFTVVQPVAALQKAQWAVTSNAYVNTACGLKIKSSGSVCAELSLAALAAPSGE